MYKCLTFKILNKKLKKTSGKVWDVNFGGINPILRKSGVNHSTIKILTILSPMKNIVINMTWFFSAENILS